MGKAGDNRLHPLLARGREFLREKGIRQYGWDALLLLACVLSKEKEYIFAHPEAGLTRSQVKRFWNFLQRRAEGIPLQYLQGVQEFWGRNFRVDSRVLIPRPETELLVEKAIEQAGRIQSCRKLPFLSIADIGTGSGCIAITLALEIKNCRVVATDISEEALKRARGNARQFGLRSPYLRFRCGDGLEPIKRLSSTTRWHMIVSNPPYVARMEEASLDREVKDHEPAVALFGGEDGLEMIRGLIPQVEESLDPDGVFLMEIGYGQETEVRDLFCRKKWKSVRFWPDYRGIPRCLQAEKCGSTHITPTLTYKTKEKKL